MPGEICGFRRIVDKQEVEGRRRAKRSNFRFARKLA
jgi:hypothetical protein